MTGVGRSPSFCPILYLNSPEYTKLAQKLERAFKRTWKKCFPAQEILENDKTREEGVRCITRMGALEKQIRLLIERVSDCVDSGARVSVSFCRKSVIGLSRVAMTTRTTWIRHSLALSTTTIPTKVILALFQNSRLFIRFSRSAGRYRARIIPPVRRPVHCVHPTVVNEQNETIDAVHPSRAMARTSGQGNACLSTLHRSST